MFVIEMFGLFSFILLNKFELENSVYVTTISWRRACDRSAENNGFDHFDDTFGIFDCVHAVFAVDLDLGYGIRSQYHRSIFINDPVAGYYATVRDDLLLKY